MKNNVVWLILNFLVVIALLSASCTSELAQEEEDVPQKPAGAETPSPGEIYRSGLIIEDETWSGTVHVTGDVWVHEGVTLTILPGTIIEVVAFSDDQHGGLDNPHDPSFPKDPDSIETQSYGYRLCGLRTFLGGAYGICHKAKGILYIHYIYVEVLNRNDAIVA